jgi:hypothetical protein
MDWWSGSWMNSWHSPKAPVRYCSMHRLLIIYANMQAITPTVMPRNRIDSVMASIPNSRNAWTLWRLIPSVSWLIWL